MEMEEQGCSFILLSPRFFFKKKRNTSPLSFFLSFDSDFFLQNKSDSPADGPIRGIVAVSTGEGATKGYVGSPMLGEMKLTEAVGLGAVQVVKNHPDWPNPYNGITAIRYGDIDRDIGKLCFFPLNNPQYAFDLFQRFFLEACFI